MHWTVQTDQHTDIGAIFTMVVFAKKQAAASRETTLQAALVHHAKMGLVLVQNPGCWWHLFTTASPLNREFNQR